MLKHVHDGDGRHRIVSDGEWDVKIAQPFDVWNAYTAPAHFVYNGVYYIAFTQYFLPTREYVTERGFFYNGLYADTIYRVEEYKPDDR